MGDDGGRHRSSLEGPEAERDRLLVAAELSTHGIWDWDLQSDELYWSEQQMRLLDVDPAKFRPVVSEFFDRLHPEDVPRVKAALKAHLEDGEPYDLVMRMRRDDGDYIVERVRGRAFRDSQGKACRIAGVLMEVTPELETRRLLEESELRFAGMAKTIPGALFQYVLHPDGRDSIVYMSEGGARLWELSVDEVGEETELLWGAVHPEDLPSMRESVLRSAKDLEPWTHRWRLLPRSGQVKWVHGRGVPTRQPDGSILWNSLVLDISEQVKTEEALRESREMFFQAQKMEALGHLTGGVAHDFNNLLTVIMSGLEALADRELRLSGERRVELEDSLHAARRGADLTRSLLTFARRATLSPERLSLREVVYAMESLLRRTLPANMTFVVDVPDRLFVHVDRGSLENALLNLLLNARDAMPNGGTVTIRAQARYGVHAPQLDVGDYVVVTVEDDGVGMAPEVASRVFEPFFTTKGSRGNGMGLSMIHGFVSQSGGAADVTSVLGQGTRVSLWFPLASPTPATAETAPAALPRPEGQALRVLLVEDESLVRKALERTLIHEGLEVSAVADGGEALRVFDASAFDVVLTDMRMPGPVQGEDIARKIGPTTPVVLFTGTPPEGPVAGATAVLTKPLRRAELVATLIQAARTTDSELEREN